MTRIIKNARASDLPISDIDRNAVVTMHRDEVEHTETTIQIQSDDECIYIDPTSISISLDKNIANDLWMAYYLPMYYQVQWLCSVIGRISRIMFKDNSQVNHPVVVTYHARTDTFGIDCHGNHYVLSCNSDRILLKSEHPILILESPLFKTNSAIGYGFNYAIDKRMIEMINELLLNRSMCDPLLSIIGYSEERTEFLKKYETSIS